MNEPVYLDHNATTPVAATVVELMLRCLVEEYGNPSSAHPRGRRAAALVAAARDSVAALVGAQAGEIIFTGCATEANNLALLGVARALSDRRHLIVSAVEHPAVLEPARFLEQEGWALTVLPVDETGRVAPAEVAAALRPDTALVSIMHASNEVGTLQPIAAIAAITRERGVLLHTDAAQSTGKIPVDVEALGVDLLTLAGHKFCAPKGVGALYIRSGTPIAGIQFGAGQEHGLRPGTENVPAIAGLGAAARLARERLPDAGRSLSGPRDRLHRLLLAEIPGLTLNGHPDERLPNTLHVSFPGVAGRDLLEEASADVVASVGSACHSEHDAVSGVLAAMGCDAANARGAVRLSTGWETTVEEIERAAKALSAAWRGLQS